MAMIWNCNRNTNLQQLTDDDLWPTFSVSVHRSSPHYRGAQRTVAGQRVFTRLTDRRLLNLNSLHQLHMKKSICFLDLLILVGEGNLSVVKQKSSQTDRELWSITVDTNWLDMMLIREKKKTSHDIEGTACRAQRYSLRQWSEEGYKMFPQWPPSFLNRRSLEQAELFLELAALVREMTKNPMVTLA